MSPGRAVVLHGEVPPDAAPDEQDVLLEVNTVLSSLRRLGWEAVPLPFSLHLDETRRALGELRPAFVFNLVESVAGEGRLCHFAPALLDTCGVPYTGSPTEAIFLSTSKLLTKRLLASAGLPTPRWLPLEQVTEETLDFQGPYIVKPVWEEASLGLDDASVVADRPRLLAELDLHRSRLKGPAFVEAFVEGREFNISVVADEHGPQVLPCAEILFADFPAHKPRLVGYAAKWDPASFEYAHTVRSFAFPPEDAGLLAELQELARRCWTLFGLHGYARVDLRVDASGRPSVLELNTNPCISPDGGFVAAAAQAGLELDEVVRRIVAAALR